MKKILITIGIILLSLQVKAQPPGIFSFVIVRDSLCLKSGGSIDSCVTVIMNDTLVNPTWVRDYVTSLGLSQPYDSVALNANITNPDVFNPFTLKADTVGGTITMFTDEPDIAIQLAQEFVIYGRNITSTTMNDGEVVYIDSSGVDPYPVFRRAIADDPEIASATIGVATHTIESGTLGYITRTGGVTMDVSVFDENAILYSSPVDSGQLVSYAPQSPYYKVRIGRVIQPGNPGILGVDVEPFTGNDTEVALDGFLNGIVLEKQSLRDTIISNVLYFETNNELRDTIDLPFMYQNEIYLLNTTSGAGKDGRAQVVLTYGTTTSATTNYIYIDNSGTPTLTANTTGFPVDGVRLAECGVFAQDTHTVYGFAYFQRFNNSINSSTTDGLMSRSVKRQRLDGSRYESGVNPTVSIITNGAAVDSLKVETTSGIIWQFNSQTYQSQDGKRYLWLNSPTGERWIGHLGEIDSTSGGVDLHGGNNRRYGLNIFAIQNSGNFNDFLAVNSPGDYYSTDESAIQDVNNYAITTVPSKYGKVTSRLYRVVVNYSSGGSGTLTNLLGAGGYQDERGQLLGIGGGGGGSSGAVTDFSDAEITIFNSADPTKIIDFDASNITTGNARTITMSDYDIDLNKVDSAKYADTTGLAFNADTSRYADSLDVNELSIGGSAYIDTIVDISDLIGNNTEVLWNNNDEIGTTSRFVYDGFDSLTVDGTINATEELYVRDTTIIDLITEHGGTGTPAGSSGDIQYNNAGSFGGAPMSTDGTDITVDGLINFGTEGVLKSESYVTLNNSTSNDSLSLGSGINIFSPSNSIFLDGSNGVSLYSDNGSISIQALTSTILITANVGLIQINAVDDNIKLRADTIMMDSLAQFNSAISTPFDEETFASSLTVDFSERSFKKVDLTGIITINISNLPEGVSTLVINQDGTGRAITIGTGWGTVADNQPSLSTTADAKNIVQFIYDGDDTTYCVVTEGN